MFKVIVFICSVNIYGADCNRATAIDVYTGPDVNHLSMCIREGQALVAENAPHATLEAISKELEYVKVWCPRSGIGKTNVG